MRYNEDKLYLILYLKEASEQSKFTCKRIILFHNKQPLYCRVRFP